MVHKYVHSAGCMARKRLAYGQRASLSQSPFAARRDEMAANVRHLRTTTTSTIYKIDSKWTFAHLRNICPVQRKLFARKNVRLIKSARNFLFGNNRSPKGGGRKTVHLPLPLIVLFAVLLLEPLSRRVEWPRPQFSAVPVPKAISSLDIWLWAGLFIGLNPGDCVSSASLGALRPPHPHPSYLNFPTI